MLIIRQASFEDRALIATISRETFLETFAPNNRKEDMDKFMNEDFSREKLEEEAGKTPGNYYLVFEDAEPAGYLVMKEGKSWPALGNKKSIELARIYVRLPAKGKGVGKLLMQQALVHAAERNMELLWLGVWEKNQPAIDFYQNWGFRKFGTHIFMLGNDPQTDWLMVRELKS